jgi:hypothetical protein
MAFFEKDNMERIKNIAEIGAILIGAIWALWLFMKKDEPTLAIREKAESILKWEKPANGDLIHAEFYVTMENLGTSKFTINKARLRGWTFKDSSLAQSQFTKYRDINLIAAGHEPFFDTTFLPSTARDTLVRPPFLGNYVENSVWSDNFEFLMKPDSTEHVLVLFLIQFYQDLHFWQNREDSLLDWTYHWDYIGGTRAKEGDSTLKASSAPSSKGIEGPNSLEKKRAAIHISSAATQ